MKMLFDVFDQLNKNLKRLFTFALLGIDIGNLVDNLDLINAVQPLVNVVDVKIR